MTPAVPANAWLFAFFSAAKSDGMLLEMMRGGGGVLLDDDFSAIW